MVKFDTGSVDAQVWAQAFLQTRIEVLADGRGDIASDEGTLIGWFANAMMAQHDKMVMDALLERNGCKDIEEYIDRVLLAK